MAHKKSRSNQGWTQIDQTAAGLGLNRLFNTTGRQTFSGGYDGDIRQAISTGLSKVPFFGGLMSGLSSAMGGDMSGMKDILKKRQF